MTVDTTIQSQLVAIEDLADVQVEGYAKNYSTVAEYHEAQDTSVDNNASKHINAGLEPYLMSRDAFELGVHPYIAVYDVMREKQDGLVGVSTPRHTYLLEPDTLLVWN